MTSIPSPVQFAAVLFSTPALPLACVKQPQQSGGGGQDRCCPLPGEGFRIPLPLQNGDHICLPWLVKGSHFLMRWSAIQPMPMISGSPDVEVIFRQAPA